MKTSSLLLILSLLILKVSDSNGELNSEGIELIISDLTNERWSNSKEDFEEYWKPINNGSAFTSVHKNTFNATCQAPFPITWNITGYIKEPEFVKIQPYKRRVNDDGEGFTFILGLLIFFSDFQPSASSSTVTCQSVQNPNTAKSINVFMKYDDNKKHFVKKNGENILIEDSNVVPCQSTDPTIPVSLFKQISARQLEKVQKPPPYNPRIGYTFPNLVEGLFLCNTSTDSITVFAQIHKEAPSRVAGYDYSPKVKTLKAFTTDPIKLSCSSTLPSSRPVVISLNNFTGILVTRNSSNTTTVDITSTSGKRYFGLATCFDVNRNQIWSWEIEFVEPPELYLDNFEGEVDCLTNYMNEPSTSVSTVRCIDTSHCQYMKHCFENPNWCNFKKQKQFYSNVTTRCYVHKYGRGRQCQSVPYSHLNGIIECKVKGLVKHWMFFSSLEYLRRDISEHVEPYELIRMDDADPILYTNYSSKFFCKASSFMFADSLRFQMEFKNGSRIIINNSSIPGIENPRKVDEANVLGELIIQLPLDAVAIRCLAPWWNSTDFYYTERRFQTRHLLKPKITSTNRTLVLVIDGAVKNQRLNCSSIGEPQPTYSWTKDGEVIEVGDKFQLTTGAQGESLLEFLVVDESLKGNYMCTASNIVDSDSALFIVDDVLKGSSSSLGTALGATIAIIVIILVAVLVILGYVVNRYLAQKELIRSLTDNEIEEFFNGNPSLLPSAKKVQPEHLDLLPYDQKYEIDLDDIEFGTSKVLGTGEFSTVVKGRWVSRNQDVAVKIAKSSADVTLFKNLLSEVKIMIFIGNHDNILSLLGVCTKNIKNRNIHIVLEFCSVGSLDVMLRKSRTSFQNVLNQQQQIDTSLLTRNEGDGKVKISTLDLIKWSSHIARGMEYLSYKGIVHADLASRNVLINNNSIAKICDFGLSKKLYECNNYVKKTKSPLPWRWMALESLHTLTFSSESDVWSFGITLWEMFTLGDIPFPNETWDKEFVGRIASGMRMGKPKYATSEIYSQLISCWDDNPQQRPQFLSLRKYFMELYSQYSSDEADNYGSRTNLTYLTEENDEEPQTVDVEGMYTNVDLDGGPTYTNLDNSGTQMYSNVP